MKHYSFYLAAALGVFLLIGCGTVGKDFPNSKVVNIKANVTTKSQILEQFGLPYKEGKQNGYTTWTYQKDTWSAFGKDSSKDLVIMFDKNGVVNAYRYTSSAP
ncbi:MAG: hypothetical protein ACE5G9_07965 [Nitrospinales bacterium]